MHKDHWRFFCRLKHILPVVRFPFPVKFLIRPLGVRLQLPAPLHQLPVWYVQQFGWLLVIIFSMNFSDSPDSSKGPFIYYVITFLGFLDPLPPYVSMFLVLKIIKIFWPPSPPYKWLRNIWMVPNEETKGIFWYKIKKKIVKCFFQIFFQRNLTYTSQKLKILIFKT